MDIAAEEDQEMHMHMQATLMGLIRTSALQGQLLQAVVDLEDERQAAERPKKSQRRTFKRPSAQGGTFFSMRNEGNAFYAFYFNSAHLHHFPHFSPCSHYPTLARLISFDLQIPYAIPFELLSSSISCDFVDHSHDWNDRRVS
jgi:hypothetical protein